jgi:processing peptidase subunit beta
MVLAAAGGIKHEDLVELAQKSLGSLSNSFDAKITAPTKCRFTGNLVACELISSFP